MTSSPSLPRATGPALRHRLTRIALPALVLALAGTAGLTHMAHSMHERTEPSGTPAQRADSAHPSTSTDPAVRATTRFAQDLLRELATRDGNLFVSPWSITTAVDMARAGAAGATAEALTRGLRLDGPGEVVDASLRELRRQIGQASQDPGQGGRFTLVEANRMWANRDGMVVRPEYAGRLQRDFGADSTSVDFSDPVATADAVNAWVKDRTRGLIPQLLTADSVPDDGLILTNAVYFLGEWQTPFWESMTRPAPFTLYDGSTVDVPMMWQSGRLAYARLPHAHVVGLNYIGPARAMFILPDEGRMDEVLASLDIAAVRSSLSPRPVSLHAPKVEVRTRGSMADALKAMGMAPAFERSADFSGMTPGGRAMIADVIHAAALKIDEKKTEAAAATGVVMGVTSAPIRDPETPIEVRLDRAFLVVITHEPTGAVLFAGRINDPRR
jgi:serpin B